MIHFYGRERAERLARAYSANQPRLLSSHSLVVTETASGEIAGAANVYGYDVLAAQASGQPIALVNPNPTVIELFCASIAQAAPHPNAARLFVRWWLSRPTQLWFRDELKRLSARKDVQNDSRLLNANVRYVFSNPADSANAADLVRTFNTIFNVPG
jgi:iron(III) transport system substrate-binding protein